MKRALLLFTKDLRIELAGMQVVPMAVVLSILIVLVFALAMGQILAGAAQAAAILTVAFLFAGIVAVERCFDSEARDGAFEGLVQVSGKSSFIFWGKFFWVLALLYFVEFWAGIVFSVMFDFGLLWQRPMVIMPVTLFNVGFAAIGVLFAAMLNGCRGKAFLLAIAVLVLMVPLVAALALALKAILSAGPGGILTWIKFMAGFDIVMGSLCVMFFEKVLE
jgi:heme exporter protein B